MSSIPNGDQIFLALRQLHNSASHLRMDCNLTVSMQKQENQDFRVLYQQVIQRAYDIAKAAKQLVTLFQ